jgi:NTE family protein
VETAVISPTAGETPSRALGIALGGGGARGLAHLGVWKVLAEEGVRPALLAGTSAGAIIAALWAAGVPAGEAAELRRTLGGATIFRPHWGWRGVLSQRPARRQLARWLEGRRLEELAVPCAVVCTDLNSGERVVLRKGPALDAALASSAVPGVYPPVLWEGRELVDGGVTTNLPVGVARECGARVVVAVDLGFVAVQRPRYGCAALVGLRALDILGKNLMEADRAAADLVLRPDVEGISVRAWGRGEELFRAGEAEARKRLPEIRRLLEGGGGGR